MSSHHVLINHPPKPLVGRAQQTRRGRHAHLLGQQQDQPFHHHREPAASPRPQIGAMLPEVEMPPPLVRCVMHGTELPATQSGKLGPRREIQRQTQLPRLHVHLAFDHFPLIAQSERLTAETIGIHAGHPERPIRRLQAAHHPIIRPFTS